MNAFEPDFSHLELNRVTSYLVATHHSFARDVMDDISTMLQNVREEQSVKEFAAIWDSFKAKMNAHMDEEENILFPLIDEIATSDDPHAVMKNAESDSVLSEMISQHDHHEDDVHKILELARNFGPDKTDSARLHKLYRKVVQLYQDLHEHLELETRVLVPRLLEFKS
ncbi:MAG: hemerythrin domain-containing protein [Leptospiraceae bacterium]|nr:hemerythrin domain-containing protein [Leptospiraceae bacterium]